MKTIVRLDKVNKYFEKGKYVLKDLSLDVYEGEFLTLLGSSGCGKTTILRLISGLDSVSSGKVYIDEKDVTNIDATKREVNTIFQNFALFPHMTVWENVAFGLKMKKAPLERIEKDVHKALKTVELEGFEDRYPAQLSGGQQQRVAIARGIIMNPKVLLLDESLCSLDLKLKRTMQLELKKIQKKTGITFIYVTHDQDEALTMSDRIVIIDKGKICQDDTPQKIYTEPKTAFVADFIGESNIIKGTIQKIDKEYTHVKISTNITTKIKANENDKIGQKIKIMIRPENIKVSKNTLKEGRKGTIKEVVYDGAITKLFIEIDDDLILKANIPGIITVNEKEEVSIKIDNHHVVPIREKNYEEK